jgi:hypothetical protein
MATEPASDDPDAVRTHEWRWFGLMCYWYASLHVVLEAWEKLQFSDPVIDHLLAHPKDFRSLLRRYRHGVFHFQESPMDGRLIAFLQQGPAHVCWIRVLHDELLRFCAQHLSRWTVTDNQHAELRSGFEAVVHWYPSLEPRQFEALKRTVSKGREMLGRHADDGSEQRRELEQALGATLRQGRHNWDLLRVQIRQAGVESRERHNFGVQRSRGQGAARR